MMRADTSRVETPARSASVIDFPTDTGCVSLASDEPDVQPAREPARVMAAGDGASPWYGRRALVADHQERSVVRWKCAVARSSIRS